MILSLASLIVAKALASPAPDPEIFDDLEHRAVRFFWDQSYPENGFTKDRATNADGEDKHTVASAAATGFALAAYAIGAERHWIPREEALRRTRVTMESLMTKWPQERGWLYHFVDWKSGERVWKSEASSIDTSICLAGVIVAQNFWHDPEVVRQAEAFEQRIDWTWMLTDGGLKSKEDHLSMGWHPESGFIPARWADYDELKMIYIQAYGLSPTMTDKGWDTVGKPVHEYDGISYIQGGPLFMHEMSESFYGFKGLRDRGGFNYEIAEKNAALANRAYCIDNPKKFAGYGPNFWGLSACDSPDGYNAFGAPGWINDAGTITPTSAVAAVTVVPRESIDFYESMRKTYPQAWGKYGFPNGFCPAKNWVDPDVIGIDLGMMMCGVENARTGFVWKQSGKSPIVIKGFERAGLHPDNQPHLLIRG